MVDSIGANGEKTGDGFTRSRIGDTMKVRLSISCQSDKFVAEDNIS